MTITIIRRMIVPDGYNVFCDLDGERIEFHFLKSVADAEVLSTAQVWDAERKKPLDIEVVNEDGSKTQF
jgi:hypothetical protein